MRSRVLAAIFAGCLLGPAGSGAVFAEEPGIRARILLQTSLAAGLAHHDARKVWERLRAGDALALVREPDNPHDVNAVRIEWQGHVLGYLPRTDNADVARQLDRGQALSARIRAITKYRNHRRKLEIDVFTPL